MKTKLLPVIILSLLVCSCEQSKKDVIDAQLIHFQLNDNEENEIKLDITEVQLELKGNDFITYVTQVAKIDDKIYILDPMTPNTFMSVYSDQGKFLESFGHKGRGRGELFQACSFMVDDSTINLSEMNVEKLVTYSLNTHKFLYSTDIPFTLTQIIEINDNELLAPKPLNNNFEADMADCRFVIVDKKTYRPTKGVLKEIARTHVGKALSPWAYKVDDSIHFADNFRPYIYTLDNGSEKAVYRLQYGDFEFPPVELIENKDYYNSIIKTDYIHIQSYGIYETTKTLLASFTAGDDEYIALYDKASGKSSLLKNKEFEDAIGYKVSHFSNSTENMIVGVVENEQSNPTLIFIK